MPLPISLVEMLQIVTCNDGITVGEKKRLDRLTPKGDLKVLMTWTFDDAKFINNLYMRFHPQEPQTQQFEPNQRVDASITQPDKPIG